MQKEKIGNVLLFTEENEEFNYNEINTEEACRHLQEIIESYEEADYHSQITQRKNYTVMYQLAESRANVIDWLQFPEHAKVLEIGAGCGTLTSKLLEKAVHVTCQEENPVYSRLNAVRHKQAGEQALAVYAMPFAQCEPQLENDYDAAVVMQIPVLGDEACGLLKKLRSHLKPDGMLVIAAENKFGLKYWAGNKEIHTKKYFAGLENAGIRLYSKNGLAKLLENAGFGWHEFYYPYPDHRFAFDIYSDKYLPKKGDLTYNIANYEDDRLVLFDEQKVFDSIIEDGQFPFFSNSYLCLAGTGQIAAKQRTVYARYATDRSRKYAVRTDMTDGSVWKFPVYQDGAVHIKNMAQAYERLSRQYADTGLKFNRCTLHKDEAGKVSAEFAFIRAEALQEHIEQAIAANNIKKVFDILHKMVQYIRNGKKSRPFEMTEEFQCVFGEISDESVLQKTQCSEVSDIDLVLPNILVTEDGVWNVIDYEWTFFFPIPQNFIIYRTLFFLNHENPQQQELAMDALLRAADIPLEEAEIYEQMETAFQQYVTGGLIPYREMVNLLERKFINIVQLREDYDHVVAQNELLKGQGIWKAVRKIKKKLTGN